MNDNALAQCLNLVDTFAQKQHLKGLCDFEYKLYESLCESMTTWFKGLNFAFDVSAMETEMNHQLKLEDYEKWVAEQEAKELAKAKQEAKEEKEKKEE